MTDIAVCARVQRCPACRTSFVCPVGWSPVGGGEEVRILLRCGQCEAWRRVTVSAAVAQQLDRAYEAARVTMAMAIADVERARLPPGAAGERARPAGRLGRVARRLRAWS
jgi:hypothetical protein